MLPAAKVLLVTVLIGGGTVGTYVLAGGKFGPGSGGAGSAETTAQTATSEIAKPEVPVPGVMPAAPTSETGTARAGENGALGVDSHQKAAVNNDGQSPQSVSQTNDQSNLRSPVLDGVSGNQGTNEVGKSGLDDSVQDTTPSESRPETKGADSEEGSPSASQISQHEGSEAVTREDIGSSGDQVVPATDRNTVDNTEVSPHGGTPVTSPTGPQRTDPDAASNPGNTSGGVGSTGTGGTGVRAASGEEETRTASGGDSA